MPNIQISPLKPLKEDRIAKVSRLCTVLANAILSIRGVYSSADATQKALLETMIGAAIWYLPKPIDSWTGFISLGALQAFHPDSGIVRPRFSEEHVYPRKVAARLLLQDESLVPNEMAMAFCERYGRLHYITPEEHKAVQPFQRANVFTTPEDAYANAGIVLIVVKNADLPSIKKRNRETIDGYLSSGKE